MRELQVVTFGCKKTGKTQLLNRYTHDEFYEEHTPTIEELYQCEKCINGQFISFKILDTQGLESFTMLRELYISGADSFILVYDVTEPCSLDGLQDLIDQIIASKQCMPLIMLVGTKRDLLSSQKFPKDAVKTANKLAADNHLPHIMASAKTGSNINEIFDQLVKLQLKQDPQHFDTQSTSSSASIESWLYTPAERTKLHAKPSLKKSLVKLKKSVSNLRGSKSVRNLKSIMSKSSFYMPKSASQQARESTAVPNSGSGNLAHSKRFATSKSVATFRPHGTSESPDEFLAADPINLDEIPRITDVSILEVPADHKKSMCLVM